jgi:hypothetical protein
MAHALAEANNSVSVVALNSDLTVSLSTLLLKTLNLFDPTGRVGTFHVRHVILQSKHQFMTNNMVHVTNMTPPGSGSDNPSVKTPIDDSRYGPCKQSCNQSDTRE